jgi:hypothetical protein
MDQARKKGLFNDKVFDPKALELSDEEKKKIQKEISRHSREEQSAGDKTPVMKVSKSPEKKEFYIELNFFERIYLIFLAIFDKKAGENFRINKGLKVIEKNLNKYKPAVYNPISQRITKYFAYKIHDAYLKIFSLKKVIEDTLGNPELWDNPERFNKTGLEYFFEKTAGINSKEVDSNFSYQGISRILADFESSKKANTAVENSIKSYLDSFETDTAVAANKAYTNLLYIKDLADFDFISFLKRFDSGYNPGVSPDFDDISSDALLPYLSELEEILFKIDLSMDNVKIFKNLFEVSVFMQMLAEPPQIVEEGKQQSQGESDSKERFENDAILCFDTLKDIMNKNYFTQLIQIVKKDPLYSPLIMMSSFDIVKIYSEIFKERITNISRFILIEKKNRKIDISVKKLFTSFKWAGIYNSDISGKIETFGINGFSYHYHLGIINTFLWTDYNETIKAMLTLTVTNGLFHEKYFQNAVSEIFYFLDKFEEKLRDFIFDMNENGVSGKKITSLLEKKEGNLLENKKNLERSTAYANVKAKELFDEFSSRFPSMLDIITKLNSDIETKPPKYLRNIRTIGGLKNLKYLNSLSKSYEILKSLQELMLLLKD